MRLFDISDVLTITTGRLVSSRHMGGVYEILNFITGDDIFTHQIPRCMQEVEPWMKTQYPQLFPDSPKIAAMLAELDSKLESDIDRGCVITDWVESVRLEFGLPQQLPVHELAADMHTRINPIEEAKALFGDDRVIVVSSD